MSFPDSRDAGPTVGGLRVAEGDIVMLGPNAAFTLEVVAVRGDRAWVRDLDDGREGVVDVADFKRFGRDELGRLQ